MRFAVGAVFPTAVTDYQSRVLHRCLGCDPDNSSRFTSLSIKHPRASLTVASASGNDVGDLLDFLQQDSGPYLVSTPVYERRDPSPNAKQPKRSAKRQPSATPSGHSSKVGRPAAGKRSPGLVSSDAPEKSDVGRRVQRRRATGEPGSSSKDPIAHTSYRSDVVATSGGAELQPARPNADVAASQLGLHRTTSGTDGVGSPRPASGKNLPPEASSVAATAPPGASISMPSNGDGTPPLSPLPWSRALEQKVLSAQPPAAAAADRVSRRPITATSPNISAAGAVGAPMSNGHVVESRNPAAQKASNDVRNGSISALGSAGSLIGSPAAQAQLAAMPPNAATGAWAPGSGAVVSPGTDQLGASGSGPAGPDRAPQAESREQRQLALRRSAAQWQWANYLSDGQPPGVTAGKAAVGTAGAAAAGTMAAAQVTPTVMSAPTSAPRPAAMAAVSAATPTGGHSTRLAVAPALPASHAASGRAPATTASAAGTGTAAAAVGSQTVAVISSGKPAAAAVAAAAAAVGGSRAGSGSVTRLSAAAPAAAPAAAAPAASLARMRPALLSTTIQGRIARMESALATRRVAAQRLTSDSRAAVGVAAPPPAEAPAASPSPSTSPKAAAALAAADAVAAKMVSTTARAVAVSSKLGRPDSEGRGRKRRTDPNGSSTAPRNDPWVTAGVATSRCALAGTAVPREVDAEGGSAAGGGDPSNGMGVAEVLGHLDHGAGLQGPAPAAATIGTPSKGLSRQGLLSGVEETRAWFRKLAKYMPSGREDGVALLAPYVRYHRATFQAAAEAAAEHPAVLKPLSVPHLAGIAAAYAAAGHVYEPFLRALCTAAYDKLATSSSTPLNGQPAGRSVTAAVGGDGTGSAAASSPPPTFRSACVLLTALARMRHRDNRLMVALGTWLARTLRSGTVTPRYKWKGTWLSAALWAFAALERMEGPAGGGGGDSNERRQLATVASSATAAAAAGGSGNVAMAGAALFTEAAEAMSAAPGWLHLFDGREALWALWAFRVAAALYGNEEAPYGSAGRGDGAGLAAMITGGQAQATIGVVPYEPDQLVELKLAGRAVLLFAQLDPGHLAEAYGLVAECGYGKDDDVMGALRKCTLLRVGAARPQPLAVMVAALGAMQVRDVVWLSALAAACRNQMINMAPEEIVIVLHSFAGVLRFYYPPVFHAAAVVCSVPGLDRVDGLGPGSLVRLAAAYAAVGHYEPKLMRRVALRMLDLGTAATPWQRASVLQATTVLAHRSNPLLYGMASEAFGTAAVPPGSSPAVGTAAAATAWSTSAAIAAARAPAAFLITVAVACAQLQCRPRGLLPALHEARAREWPHLGLSRRAALCWAALVLTASLTAPRQGASSRSDGSKDGAGTMASGEGQQLDDAGVDVEVAREAAVSRQEATGPGGDGCAGDVATAAASADSTASPTPSSFAAAAPDSGSGAAVVLAKAVALAAAAAVPDPAAAAMVASLKRRQATPAAGTGGSRGMRNSAAAAATGLERLRRHQQRVRKEQLHQLVGALVVYLKALAAEDARRWPAHDGTHHHHHHHHHHAQLLLACTVLTWRQRQQQELRKEQQGGQQEQKPAAPQSTEGTGATGSSRAAAERAAQVASTTAASTGSDAAKGTNAGVASRSSEGHQQLGTDPAGRSPPRTGTGSGGSALTAQQERLLWAELQRLPAGVVRRTLLTYRRTREQALGPWAEEVAGVVREVLLAAQLVGAAGRGRSAGGGGGVRQAVGWLPPGVTLAGGEVATGVPLCGGALGADVCVDLDLDRDLDRSTAGDRRHRVRLVLLLCGGQPPGVGGGGSSTGNDVVRNSSWLLSGSGTLLWRLLSVLDVGVEVLREGGWRGLGSPAQQRQEIEAVLGRALVRFED